MKRTALAAISAVSLVPMLAVGAAAAPPRMYHNINVETAYLSSVSVEDCLQTELYVSGTTGHWAGDHGPSVKQEGPSAVFVRVLDVCSEPEGIGPAAAPPVGDVVLEVEAQAMVGVRMDQRLTTATLSGAMDGTDHLGNPVTLQVDAHWTGTGELAHEVTRNVTHYPEGNVAAVDNIWTREATGTATVTLPGWELSGTDEAGVLQRVKGHCIEIPKGSKHQPEEFYPCFGFPG